MASNRHPFSPPSNSKIKPPYIPPPPKQTMNKPTLWLPTIKRYDDGFTIPSMTEAQYAGYVSYPDYLDIKARADALDAEVKAMWKENYELRSKVETLTPPFWLRVVAWLISFVGAFWLAHLVLNWMSR